MGMKPKLLVGLLITLVITLLFYITPSIIDLLSYPDARIKSDSATCSSTKVFNARGVKNYQSGVNFALALHAPREGDWGVVLGESDFDAAQKAGFHYIRVPVSFLSHLNCLENGYQLDPNFLSRLDWVVEKIVEREMIAIVDFHLMIPDNKVTFSSEQDKVQIEEKFLAIWKILANHYRDYSTNLYFELANEPHRPITPELWNVFAQKAISQIRETGGNNSVRTIVVGTNVRIGWLIHNWDQVNNIEKLHLPSVEDDPYIMVTFHYYNPYPFSHQELTYTKDLTLISWLWKGHTWVSSNQQIAYIRKDFDRINLWARRNKRKIILGEFGASIYADIGSQVRWTKLVREEAESRDMIWIFWDFFDQDELGALYNQQTGSWRKEILDALFPEGTSLKKNYQSASYIQELIGRLSDHEWKDREKAAISLSLSGPDGKVAIPALITALEDKEWKVRKAVAQALANIGPASYPAIQALTKKLRDEEWQVRKSATNALANIGKDSRPALPELIALLNDEEWQVRKQAVMALDSIAPGDGNVRAALQQTLDDPEEQVRQTTKLVLRKYQSKHKIR